MWNPVPCSPRPRRSSTRPFTALIAAAVATFAACAPDSAVPGAIALPRLRDSSGVEIAELQENPWNAPVWASLDSARALRILPVDSIPATLFGRIRGTIRLSSGEIAVLDAGNHQIRIFDAAGGHVRSIGRQGEGPAEFSRPWRLMRGRADSLVAYDFSGVIQIFGNVADSARRVRLPWNSATGGAQVLETFPNGDFLAIRNDFRGDIREGRNPLFSSLHVMTADGDSGVAMGRQISTEFVYKKVGGGLEQLGMLFWAEPGMDGLSDGYVWCLPREFNCAIWSSGGTQIRSIRADFAGAPVTRAHVDSLAGMQLADAATASDSTRLRNYIDESDVPEAFPVLSMVRTDMKDRIWMREYIWRTTQRSARWLVFEKTGVVLGTVSLPARMTVFEIGADYVLGSDSDENDVQHVVMFPILIRGL